MIQLLQSLFNRLAGIHACEAMLRQQAHAIFATSIALPEAVETPAYLRRERKSIDGKTYVQ